MGTSSCERPKGQRPSVLSPRAIAHDRYLEDPCILSFSMAPAILPLSMAPAILPLSMAPAILPLSMAPAILPPSLSLEVHPGKAQTADSKDAATIVNRRNERIW